MALEMIKEATKAGVSYEWATVDCAYGDFRSIRLWLEEQRKCYALCVSGKEHVWIGYQQQRVSEPLKNLPEETWAPADCGDDSKGARVNDWQTVSLNPSTAEEWERCLLVRRNKTKAEELRTYVCFAPKGTPLEKLIKIVGIRWTVERCFAESKSDIRILLWFRYRIASPLQQAVQWMQWRREHQVRPMWRHFFCDKPLKFPIG